MLFQPSVEIVKETSFLLLSSQAQLINVALNKMEKK